MRTSTVDIATFVSRSRGRTTALILAFALAVPILLIQAPLPALGDEGDVVGTAPLEIPALENEIHFSDFVITAPIDPSGIAFLGGNKLLIADSEIEEEVTVYDGNNLWEINLNGTGLTPVGNSEPTTPTNQEPTGLAYNSADNRTYITRDNDPRRIWDINRGGDGIFDADDDRETFNPTLHPTFDPADLEDVAWDSRDEILWVANGIHGTVIPISPGPDGLLGGADTQAGEPIDVSAWVQDVEGLAYRESTDTLLLTRFNPDRIVEITKDGRLVREITTDGIINRHPTDLVVAPASDGPGESVYLTDRGLDNGDPLDPAPPPDDGRLYEIDVRFDNLSPFVDAGPNMSVAAGAQLAITGDAYDDGQPTPGAFSVSWSESSGPGTVTFSDPGSLETHATFSSAGTYVLRLTASDGVYDNTDTMQVTVSGSSSGGDGTFIDDDGSTFEADIEWIAAEGITKGCNPPVNDRYCPDDFVTRGQMAAFLHRALDDVLSPTEQVEFIDDNGNTFEADIEWLGGTGVTKGCNPPDNDQYCPDDFVTRGQMAAFLVRGLGYTDDGGGDLFIDDDGNTFEADIDKLGTAGVTKGCNPPTNDQYCPNDFVTRGQMAAFLRRALEG
jgi:hypothetical protein